MKPIHRISFSFFWAGAAGLLVLAIFGSCTDPITVGSDLLEDDRLEVDFDDDLPISIKTVALDTFNVFEATGGSLWPRVSFGAVSDGVFGSYSSGIYLFFQPQRNSSTQQPEVPQFIEFKDSMGVQLDSVVVLLAVDTTSFYGPVDSTNYEYALTGLTGQPDFDLDYILTDRFPMGDLAGDGNSFELTGEPTLLADTMVVGSDSAQAIHQRFRLNADFVQRLADLDTSDFRTDTTFAEAFPGFFLNAMGESEGIFNFDMANSGRFDGMIAYFTDTIGDQRAYRFLFSRWLQSIERDRAGSTADMILDDNPDEVFSLIESQAGLMTEITLTDLTSVQGRIINQARLDVYPASVTGFDSARFPAPFTIMLFARDEDGELEQIDDVDILSAPSQNNIRTFVDGVLDDELDPPRYEVNLTVHLQRILDGEADPQIYLAIIPRVATPVSFLQNQIDLEFGRLPINGPAASENKMQLRVAYTNL
ncbi:MAG: DUF4270 family protein [Bacteroidota bacterium]